MTAMLDGTPRSATREFASQPAVELTILMPCLNEAETLERCIRKARVVPDPQRHRRRGGDRRQRQHRRVAGASPKTAGARVVPIRERGYGSALLGGIRAARGRYVVMGDSDDSYDFGQLDGFVAKLREGYELVMGNRFKGGILPGAMPPLHRYLGNPVLTTIGRIFFSSPCGDFHCGLRGFDREAILVARPAGTRAWNSPAKWW